VLDDNPNQFVEIDPATGAQVGAAKATPFDINFGGLAVDAVTSDLWVASSQVNTIAEINPATGAVVRTIDLAPQGLSSEASGLAFDASNRLLVSSIRGVVYRVDIPGVTISSESAALLTAGVATSSSSEGSIDTTDTSLAVAFTQQASWLSNFVNGGTSQKADDDELVIALPSGV
jgi:DNA-binding beta-propeller fold protein YncE